MHTSPISTTFTLASCLKYTTSVCTSTLKNKPVIVVLLSSAFLHPFSFSWEAALWLHKHGHPLDSTEQLLKILHNHHWISDNLQMTCKRRAHASRNQCSGGKSNNPNGGDELKLFTVFRENGLGISLSWIIKFSASLVWSFSKFGSTGKTFFRLQRRLPLAKFSNIRFLKLDVPA